MSLLVLWAEGVDGLSGEVTREQRVLESTSALRLLVMEEAARLGWAISVNLSASSSTCIVPRFFARFPEPLAEVVDALAQPDSAFRRATGGDRCSAFPS